MRVITALMLALLMTSIIAPAAGVEAQSTTYDWCAEFNGNVWSASEPNIIEGFYPSFALNGGITSGDPDIDTIDEQSVIFNGLNTFLVNPSLVQIEIVKSNSESYGYGYDLYLLGRVNIFGIQGEINDVVPNLPYVNFVPPPETVGEIYSFTPSAAGVADFGYQVSINSLASNINVGSTVRNNFKVNFIRVYGRGAYPFTLRPTAAPTASGGFSTSTPVPSADQLSAPIACNPIVTQPTPTPTPMATATGGTSVPTFTQTPTIEATYTASSTPSPTPTGSTSTPTNTPGSTCGNILEERFEGATANYRLAQFGYLGSYGGSMQILGVDYDDPSPNPDLDVTISEVVIRLPVGSQIKHVEWKGTANSAGGVYLMNRDRVPLLNYGFAAGTAYYGWLVDFPASLYSNEVIFAMHGFGLGRTVAIDDVWISYCMPPTTPTLTYTPTITRTPTRTPSITRTPSLTRTPNPFATRTLTPLPTLNLSSTRRPTLTPSRTPAPVIPPTRVPPSNTPSNTPGMGLTLSPAATSATLSITSSATGSTPVMTTTATSTAVATVMTSPTPMATSTAPPEGLGDWLSIGGGIINTVTNLWSRGQSYIEQLTGQYYDIMNAWDAAPSTTPPNLPRCERDPLSSDLCAIWYIMQWTIFSGDIGGLILPVALIIVDLGIVFVFIKQARAILARAAEVLEV